MMIHVIIVCFFLLIERYCLDVSLTSCFSLASSFSSSLHVSLSIAEIIIYGYGLVVAVLWNVMLMMLMQITDLVFKCLLACLEENISSVFYIVKFK